MGYSLRFTRNSTAAIQKRRKSSTTLFQTLPKGARPCRRQCSSASVSENFLRPPAGKLFQAGNEVMLISNATLITWGQPNQILFDHAIYIQDGKIVALGPDAELRSRYPDAPLTDARGQFILPGNICAHTHFYGPFSRGMAIPGEAPADFPQILEKLWWPLDRSLTDEDIRYSALLCLADALRHGTTTLFDHHASPNAIPGCLDILADAVDLAGLRAVLCYEVSDRDGPEKARAGIAENVRFIQHTGRKPLLAAVFGLHASLSLSDQTLE